MYWDTVHVCSICGATVKSKEEMEEHDRTRHPAPESIVASGYCKQHKSPQTINVRLEDGNVVRYKFDKMLNWQQADNAFNRGGIQKCSKR